MSRTGRPFRIPVLVPDLPEAEALMPWLARIDAARWYTNFGPLVPQNLASSAHPHPHILW